MKRIHIACRATSRHDFRVGWYCPHCRRDVEAYEVTSVAPFWTCISSVEIVDLNSKESANQLLGMIRDGIMSA